MDYPEEEKLTKAAREPLEFTWKAIDQKLPQRRTPASIEEEESL